MRIMPHPDLDLRLAQPIELRPEERKLARQLAKAAKVRARYEDAPEADHPVPLTVRARKVRDVVTVTAGLAVLYFGVVRTGNPAYAPPAAALLGASVAGGAQPQA